ncbi:MAG TPA: LEA type 2 family protein, partial [Ktedonobacterales bacterium]|nr:LEA type 2 family protein [Ktedonobacterales bacterium]
MKRVALLAVVLLAGCAMLKSALQFQEPQVELKQINVTGIGLTGGTLDLVFDVFNPNDYRLRSTRLEAQLDLERTHFADGLIDKPLDLSPANHSQVVMPIRFEWAGVGAGARALLTKQAVAFGITGTVFLDTPLGDKQVKIHGSGNVPLSKLR